MGGIKTDGTKIGSGKTCEKSFCWARRLMSSMTANAAAPEAAAPDIAGRRFGYSQMQPSE